MTPTVKAILVDDEESARNILGHLLQRFCPEVHVVGSAATVMQAVQLIEAEQPDLVFLDIEMPNYAGFEIVRFFKEVPFKIIFVTAYDHYAVRAFEVSAIDYLLKPIHIERLRQAVQRALQHVKMEQQAERLEILQQTFQQPQPTKLAIFDKGQQYILPINDIIAIEAQESYSTIYTTERTHFTSKNLRHFEQILQEYPHFLRVHRSWIIQKRYIQHYSRTDLTITLQRDILAKLSRHKKSDFEREILKQ